MCTIGTGESNTQDQAEDGMYTFYIRSEIPVKSNKYLYDCEAVITIGDGNIGRVFHYVNGKFDLHQRCYKMTDFENVWGKYFYYFFSTRFYDRAMKMTAKATVDSVRIEMISEMYILKPAEINEQKNIADFFTHLDHLITLHQSKPFGHILKVIASYTLYWEQRKLLSITTMHARIGWQNLRTTEFLDDGKYLLITGTDFVDGKIDFTRCYYVKQERYNQDRNIQIKNGCILITKDGTLGKVAYVNGLNKPATLNAGIFNVEIRDENKVDRLYLYQYIKAPFLLEYVNQMATGGTIKHLNQNILVDFMVSMPQSMEQKKIGELFQILDHLITLHQRKLEKLKIIKRSMLENLFPKNGEKTPKIRFSGFTEDWEQRKLGEIVVIERGGSPRPIEKYITELNDGLNWIKIGDAPTQGRYITKTSEKIKESGLSKTRQVFPGDLILSNSMSFGKPYIMEIEGCIHDGWLLIRDKNNVFDLKFLCHMLSTEYLLNQYKMFAAGSTVNNLNKELVGNASVRFPEMLEQNKIGKYLESLDHLITLHQLEPFKLIFKAIAYRIIDYAKSKPPRYIKYADLN